MQHHDGMSVIMQKIYLFSIVTYDWINDGWSGSGELVSNQTIEKGNAK